MFNNIPIEKFEPNDMDITISINQFMSYWKAYNVSKEKQSHLFLTNVGHGLYANLKDEFAPLSLGEQSFADIQARLKQHFSPRVNIIVERYRFHMMRQK